MKNINKLVLFLFVLGFFVWVSSVLAMTSGPVNPYSFSAASGEKPGTVKITWYDDTSAKTYNLLYGTDTNNYNFGVVNMAHAEYQTSEFTVEYLTPGKTYYFLLLGMGGGDEIKSGPVKAVAASTTKSSVKPNYYSQSKNYEMPYLFSISYGDSLGGVNITWFDNDSANKYDIVYGVKPYEYLYGVQNVPYQENFSNTFTIRSLSPGKTYYFALVAERNNRIVLWSQPLSILAR